MKSGAIPHGAITLERVVYEYLGTADRVIIGLEALGSVLWGTMAVRVITEVGEI